MTSKRPPPAAGKIPEIPEIPPEIPWVMRVDGHTDKRPVTGQFRSNWELSAARAASVVHLLTDNGLNPGKLAVVSYSGDGIIGVVDPTSANFADARASRAARSSAALTIPGVNSCGSTSGSPPPAG